MLGIGTSIIHNQYLGLPDLKEVTDGAVNNLDLWLKNNTDIAADQWNDQSGDNRHVAASEGQHQASVSNGGLHFDGTNDHYDFSTITIAQNQGFCLAVVMNQDEGIDNNTILSKDTDDVINIVSSTSLQIVTNAGGSADSSIVFDSETTFDNSKMLLLINRAAGSQNVFTFFKDGTQIIPNSSSSNLEAKGENPFGFDINVLGARAGTSQFFDGKILELAFWSRGLTSEEIVGVNSYLKEIHGL